MSLAKPDQRWSFFSSLFSRCHSSPNDSDPVQGFFRSLFRPLAHSSRYPKLCPVHRSFIAMSGSSDQVAAGLRYHHAVWPCATGLAFETWESRNPHQPGTGHHGPVGQGFNQGTNPPKNQKIMHAAQAACMISASADQFPHTDIRGLIVERTWNEQKII